MILVRLANAYFCCFTVNKDKFDPTEMLARSKDNLANSPELLRLKEYFLQNSSLLNDEHDLIKISKMLSPEPFDKELCIRSFYPCMILFFLRVFDIYDSALQGLTVDELAEKIKQSSKEKPAPKDEKDAIKTALGEKLLSKFGEVEFWKSRYANITSDTKPYDWYTTWKTIASRVIEKAQLNENQRPLKILELGCGNSSLSTDLVLDERLNIEMVTSIDFVPEIADAQNDLTSLRNLQNKLKFECVDVLDLPYTDNHFDLVIEKGCIDSVMATKNASVNFDKACKNISRVLRPGGFFVVISCALSIDRLTPFKNVSDYRWKVTYLSELPSDTNPDVKINVILIKKLTEEEVKEEIEKMNPK